MKCSVCGSENGNHLRFCVLCGARLTTGARLGGASAHLGEKGGRTAPPAAGKSGLCHNVPTNR